MIVHTPTKIYKDGNIILASRFEMQKSIPYLPQELWYRFPEHYAEYLSPRVDAFVPTALLVAMYAGEKLRVQGKISPRLAYNLFEFRDVHHSFDSKLFHKVDISYDILSQHSSQLAKRGSLQLSAAE
ncbi:MAG: hypothetical protein IMY76_02330 [Chloroflexi bacterium]|nr:hypothetical protein [Chloroflexota bacterium]